MRPLRRQPAISVFGCCRAVVERLSHQLVTGALWCALASPAFADTAWVYVTETDPVGGGQIHLAMIYDDKMQTDSKVSSLGFVVGKAEAGQAQVIFMLDQGAAFLCNTSRDTVCELRIDVERANGGRRGLVFAPPMNDMGVNVLSLDSESDVAGFVDLLRQGVTLWIETRLRDEGLRRFKFNVAGFVPVT